MKKKICLLISLLAMVLTACGNTSDESAESIAKEASNDATETQSEITDPNQLFISNLVDHLTFENSYYEESNDTGTNGVTPDDISMYNDVMEALNDYSRSEEEILNEIAPTYDMTVEELTNFMNSVMPYATGLEEMDNANEPDANTLISLVSSSLDQIVKVDFYVPMTENLWSIEKTNYRYVIKTDNFTYEDAPHSLIIKIEFDESYKAFSIFQIKVDGYNIDF